MTHEVLLPHPWGFDAERTRNPINLTNGYVVEGPFGEQAQHHFTRDAFFNGSLIKVRETLSEPISCKTVDCALNIRLCHAVPRHVYRAAEGFLAKNMNKPWQPTGGLCEASLCGFAERQLHALFRQKCESLIDDAEEFYLVHNGLTYLDEGTFKRAVIS